MKKGKKVKTNTTSGSNSRPGIRTADLSKVGNGCSTSKKGGKKGK